MKAQQVMTILRPVKEPFIHKRFVEIDAIKSVEVNEATGEVAIEIALSKLNQPENIKLKEALTNKLLQAGARDVHIVFSQLPEEQLKQYPQYQVMMSPLLNGAKKTAFLAVASGKGGVGKSTVTANLAVNLARLGKKVGIIDADIYGFSIPHMMGVSEKPTLRGNKIIPVEAYGVKVMSMDFFVEGNDPVIWRGPRLGKMLNSFFIEVEWGDVDYLLIDLPPGTGDMALNVHNLLPLSKEIIVTTPHKTAAHVASRAGKMALNTHHDIIGVVENMAYFESRLTKEREYVFGKGGGEWLAKELNAPLLATIPLGQPDDSVTATSIYQDEEPIGLIYKRMAEAVIAAVQ